MKKTNVMEVVSVIVTIIMIVCVKVVTPVCSGMLDLANGKQAAMKCHYTGIVLLFLAVLLLLNTIVGFVTKQSLACGIMTVIIAVFVFVVLNDTIGIGICMNTEMACHVTAPLAQICATVQIIIGIIISFFSCKKDK